MIKTEGLPETLVPGKPSFFIYVKIGLPDCFPLLSSKFILPIYFRQLSLAKLGIAGNPLSISFFIFSVFRFFQSPKKH